MTLSELKSWMNDHSVSDSWWVAIGTEVQDDLQSLSRISKLKEQHRNKDISVLHEAKAGEEDAEWIPFKHDVVRVEVEISQELAESVQSVLSDVRSEVENLKTELAALRDLAEMLKQPLTEAKRFLAEHDSLLDASERVEPAQMTAELEAATQASAASDDLLIAI
ncbi:hypothetical protein [Rubellicoccus peritrichatus]|uniref:Uncharacterized protein n=1 Tax=Rubellicoccus peritrichatus TaxID=3080537 RepID=A0AAQ3LCX1_9BACT|nr:hypothetical protein [Puniceicoccus sp. CR14]WOO42144.1 hypothetical protein RZN69_03520 [Puniceicoccus sp. CR14]